jgi:hypothetical protein
MNRSRFWSASSIILAFALVSTAFARSDPPEILPGSAGDDTALLQGALSNCSREHEPCIVHLGAGVFYTDVLLAQGFSGSITGRGQDRTIIRPILSRPLRSTLNPFFGEPTVAQPYPVLLHFADGGKVSLSGFTMDFPPGMTVTPYNHYLLGPDGLGITDYLLAAIMVEGDRNAELLMNHVTIIGRDSDSYWGSNIANAVRFEGKLRFSGDYVNLVDRTRKLQRGRFVAHDNHIIRSGNGLWVEDTNNTAGLFFDNEIDAHVFGVIMTNLGNSNFQTIRNHIRTQNSDGVIVYQTLQRPPEDPSDYVIALNKINAEGEAFDGVATVDDAALQEGLTGTMEANVDIWGNDITLLGTAVSDGIEIFADGPGDMRVFGNRIRGAPTDSGIWVEFSVGTFIAANDLRGIDPALGDVSLRETSRECRVIEPGDSVLDLGVDNHVVSASATLHENASRVTPNATRVAPSRSRSRPGFSWQPQQHSSAQ